jgi:hypothetical protein
VKWPTTQARWSKGVRELRVAGCVAVPESRVLRRDEAEPAGEPVQQRLPHPGRGGESVQEQDRRRILRAGLAVEDRQAVDVDRAVRRAVHGCLRPPQKPVTMPIAQTSHGARPDQARPQAGPDSVGMVAAQPDDDQVVAQQGLGGLAGAIAGQCPKEGLDQACGGEVADLVPGLTGGDPGREAPAIAVVMALKETATTPTSPPLGRWFAPPRSDDRRDRGCSSASRTGVVSAASGTEHRGRSIRRTRLRCP